MRNGIIHVGIEIRAHALQVGFKNARDFLAQCRAETVARHVNKAGNIAPEGIAAHEDGDALALLEPQDIETHPEQILHPDLEQLVARVFFENMPQGLAVVRAGQEPRGRQDLVHLLAQIGNVADAARIGHGGKQAEEKFFAFDVSLRIVGFDGDGVHRHAAVDCGQAVGLGH